MPTNLRKFLPAGLLVLGVAVPVLLAVEATHQQACDRDCLLTIAGNYVAAALVHPAGSKVSFDPGLKSTENGKPVSPGGGVWATTTAVPVRQAFADASTGEATVFGTLMQDHGRLSRFALRLKIDHRLIREVETVVSPEPLR